MNKAGFRDQFDVSRETMESFTHFVGELMKWTKTINLISNSTVDQIWERHIADSAQLFHHIGSDANKLVDLGSGGGLPALVLAIMSKSAHPDLAFLLIESDQRKAAFLSLMVGQLDLNAHIIAKRTESAVPSQADILTCRGYAHLDKALLHITRHLQPSGYALLPKGETASVEVEEAKKKWNFTLTTIQSITRANASVLKIQDISLK